MENRSRGGVVTCRNCGPYRFKGFVASGPDLAAPVIQYWNTQLVSKSTSRAVGDGARTAALLSLPLPLPPSNMVVTIDFLEQAAELSGR
jgi:hypothetical protein